MRPLRKRPPGDAKRAFAYVRVSTDEQKLGPEAQRTAIRAWATAQSVEVAAWYEDLGVSGSTDSVDRPGLSAALEALPRARVGILVVAKRDRLARDVRIVLDVEKRVEWAGGRIQSVDGIGNGTTATDEFMRTIDDARGQLERKQIAERTKAALATKKARGERTGNVPFGYRSVIVGGVATLRPDLAERAVVALVLKLHAEDLSAGTIVDELARLGHLSRAGTPFQKPQVQRIVWRARKRVCKTCGRTRAEHVGPTAECP